MQYVDDLLATAFERECLQTTRDLLSEMGSKGFRATAKNAQICKTEVTFLGYKLTQGQKWLIDAMKETILRIPVPKTPKEVGEFRELWGVAGFGHPDMQNIVRSLYEPTKERVSWNWGDLQQQAFEEMCTALLSALALTLPDPSKPFNLFLDEKRGVQKVAFTQKLGP